MKQILELKTVAGVKLALALLGLLTLITSVEALPFAYQYGDLRLGFRKTGNYQGLYEIVVDIGPATNYLKLTAGTTINITQYTASQIVPDSYANFTNLQWSVTGDTYDNTTFSGYQASTLWVTTPRVSGVSTVPYRSYRAQQEQSAGQIDSILDGAVSISSSIASNQDNTATSVQEPYSKSYGQNYGAFISDPTYPNLATLQGYGPVDKNGSIINLENNSVAPFSTPIISDLYQLVPQGYTDPQTGLTSGAAYNVGYFTLNVNGTMTFTRASTTVAAPVAGFTASPTNGVAPLAVTFTDASTGTITNWLWNLGDGHSVTNTSNASVNHSYTNSGPFTVSLTVTGPGGNNTLTRTSYIGVIVGSSTAPKFNGLNLNLGTLVIGGANGTVGAQYRVLVSTNLASTNWVPVLTNFFTSSGAFSYTNNAATNRAAFYKIVSP